MSSRTRTVRTPEKDAHFLEYLALGASISQAAANAGYGRRTVYEWREADEEFAAAWNDALEIGTDTLEDEVMRRPALISCCGVNGRGDPPKPTSDCLKFKNPAAPVVKREARRTGQRAMAVRTAPGTNRIRIFGPKTDGTYIVEFRTAAGDSLAITIRGSEAAAIRYFQERAIRPARHCIVSLWRTERIKKAGFSAAASMGRAAAKARTQVHEKRLFPFDCCGNNTLKRN